MAKQASIRTSSSHPLRIDAVTVSDVGGQIGMTLCPGRRDKLSQEGAWERDLTADIATVSAWRPDMVLTLVEDFEFELLGVPAFAVAMLQANLPWRHLPIRDAGVPDASFEDAWRTTGLEARAILMRGGRVLVHCRAGLGRTGMIAARLLVELGSTPAEAVAAVRGARSGTIETRAQERHVRDVRVVGA
jgi:ADP-ribosyl-[dinitrogen reductase] hydrolase